MTTETMNIHKALCELKILEDRINNCINSAWFCVANKNSNTKIKGESIEQFTAEMKSDFDRIADLIMRREAIKRAVVLSNAKTEITVNGVNYTVAEAIEMKNHGMDFDKALYHCMTSQYANSTKIIDAANDEELSKKADAYVIGLYGTKENAVKTDDIEKVKEAFINSNSFSLIDPIGVKEISTRIKDRIDNFMSEVDSALSTSNALTVITIEY